MQFFQKLVPSLLGLGAKRLALLGLVGVVIFSMLVVSIYSFRQPVRSVLYSGLDKADVSAIGAALSEVGIPFDVSETGDTVLVDFGKTAQARMLLAERGLPKSDKSGYELFDQMGSLGLTSFMQQVTKVRALEGELVRTIQQLDGIKSARVHLALKADGVLRNSENKPTASVVIRIDGTPKEALASTIRHLVAAAIPGLQADQVMVSTTDGKLLAGPRMSDDSSTSELLDLETRLSGEISKRVENTLEPFAGSDNIRVSVSTTINLDKKQINETKYDPNSKVERSLYIVKSVDNSKDSTASSNVSVDQNIPREVKSANTPEPGSKKKEDKQETVNYEVDSKQTATMSAGYIVERMSIAVVVNKKAILNGLPEGSTDKDLAARLSEMESVVRSASGVVDTRGDLVKVSAIDFHVAETIPETMEELGLGDYFKGNLGTIINAISLISAMLIVLLLGLRPALKILLTEVNKDQSTFPLLANESKATPSAPKMDKPEKGFPTMDFGQEPVAPDASPKDQLNKLVNVDVDRAAQVLKNWLNDSQQRAA
jgi:flagellar M-ring protein FliF